MVRFEIDVITSEVIVAFRKYNSVNREPIQSIIVWWVYGSAVFKIIKDYGELNCYFFEESKKNIKRGLKK